MIFFLILVLGAGGLGVWVTTLEIDAWNPPDKVCFPVGTAFYLMMGVAAWIVWKPAGFRAAAGAHSLFATPLLLNVAWLWFPFADISLVGLAFKVWFYGCRFVRPSWLFSVD